MIDFLRMVAIKGQSYRAFAPILALFALSLFCLEIFDDIGDTKDDYFLIPSVVLLLWALVIYIMLYSFPGVPNQIRKDSAFFKRARNTLVRLYFHILALIFVVSTIAVISFSFKLLGVWLNDFN